MTRRALMRRAAYSFGLTAAAYAGLSSLSILSGDRVGYVGTAVASELDSGVRRLSSRGLATSRLIPSGKVALGLYRPSFPDDLSAVDEHYQETAHQLRIVHWYALWGGWKREFSLRDLQLVQGRGSIPMVTWEPWAGEENDPSWSIKQAILSGNHDAYIESWAKGLADFGGPVLLRFAHEMHDRPYPWAVGIHGNTSEQYLQAWRHVRGIFDRYTASNVQWIWNPNSVGATIASDYEPVYRSLYPGDDQVEWLGIDVYNTGPRLDWGAPYWRSFPEILNEPYQALTKISDRLILLPEVGSAETGGSKAAWIREAIQASQSSRFPRVAGLVWFDVMKEEQWALDSSVQSTQAWRSAAREHLRVI